MREKRRKFTPEFKAEAVRLVIDTSRPIAEVAREIGVHEGTLGNWVNQYRAEHAGDEPVGAENSVTSCCLHVFVDEAAEPVAS